MSQYRVQSTAAVQVAAAMELRPPQQQHGGSKGQNITSPTMRH